MTEPRKTPRTEAAELPWVANTQVACYGPCVKADFARAIEIETQELAELLEKINNSPELWRIPKAGGQDQYAGMPPFCRLIDAALIRHRAKQEVRP